MRLAVISLIIILVSSNIYLGYQLYIRAIPIELYSKIPHNDNLDELLTYMDGFYLGVTSNFGEFNDPSIYYLTNPRYQPNTIFEQGYSEGMITSESKCQGQLGECETMASNAMKTVGTVLNDMRELSSKLDDVKRCEELMKRHNLKK